MEENKDARGSAERDGHPRNCENDFEEIADEIGEGRRRGFLYQAEITTTQESFSTTLRQGFAFNLPDHRHSR